MSQGRVSLTLRIFLVYAVFVALGGGYIVHQAIDQVKPAVRQSTEETLVDTANLLAEIVSKDVAQGTLDQAGWSKLLKQYGRRRPNANIWGVDKAEVNHQIYIVDRHGKVLLDSRGQAVGQDYSQWRDVYLTLRGKYGARSTRAVADDDGSTVMYVAAPIFEGDRIIGAVTVGKANHTVQPFIVAAERRLLQVGAGLLLAGLLVGAALSYWLSYAIQRLTQYARRVSAGERAQVPELPGGELSQLAQALESMRSELDGKAYVERYVQTLTHELKSPLAAIRAAAELLRRDMPEEKRERFLQNIDTESERLQTLSDRLLSLAQVEKRRGLEEHQVLDAAAVWTEVLERFDGRLTNKSIAVTRGLPEGLLFRGEQFLVSQALSNLLENAVDFTPSGGEIRVTVATVGASLTMQLWNSGAEIPSYALSRVTERFYSLPRPNSGRKSTGLGLSFVVEVAHLHGGELTIGNHENGVMAQLTLPLAMARHGH